MKQTMSNLLVRVHWLNKSRAFRLLWLLDHLKVEYEIIPYMRVNNRAPESLKKIHPLGRSPILEIEDKVTGKKKILAESGYIFQYVLEHFDTDNILKNEDIDMNEKIQFYLFYTEGSLQSPLMMEYILSLAKESPFPISYLVTIVANKISEAYSKGEVKNQLDFVEAEIANNRGYLVDGKLSGADIIMSFPCQMAFLRKFAKEEDYPLMKKWLETITATPSYKSSIEKVHALGSSM
ncbi:hypothetical protein KAFR_0D05170 [Kazachstania africana CBS 2517]|uniref:GST N-terminal domain-containing protein n=1 Tax=Kazachstania africana (strain ATCC 22294 / BCRC 22015 / CBS 2517 / CECT 1963 / NBRC 1671 / NRRL Y-8276) TaxID=1071382 RepID=H2AUW2_KAZAF|nr:hypothetical protein KAFR_0D05170 [Kazachstania africana CBS 2517]CCF58162.1 hypothetical protein KAFR_0D05170 [Kazachstania africana CBS 2517]